MAAEADHFLRLRMVRLGSHKLIVEEQSGSQLYDLSVDPGEREDLAAAKAARVKDLEERLRHVLAAPPSTNERPLTEKELERLRSLGYVN